jgi:hypothetical protein
MSRRTLLAFAMVGLIATGCSSANTAASDKGPRPVTSEEAARLATMRVKNYEEVGTGFHAVIQSAQGAVTLNGDVDFHNLTGYAEVSDGNGQSYTLQWNGGSLLAWPSKGRPTEPPSAIPTGAPRERALSPSTVNVDAVLTILLGLGESRPDNAKEVQQDGARWLRTATIDGTKVDVMQGPSAQGSGHGSNTSLDFWVDASGQLRRVDIYLSGSKTPSQVDLDPSTFNEFQASPYLTATSGN